VIRMETPLKFHRSGNLLDWAIEDANGRHICIVHTEEEAREICEAFEKVQELEALKESEYDE
jgi:hypothetical protein